ncbi:MAG: DUF3786 domain-containing protein [Desulfobacteraceae bacterium]|nr:DUF3786 domain-containing protein [Desulfobacteraceae bacterium]
MSNFVNVMEVFKLLEKTNCRKCNEKTCLVFATKVFNASRPLSDCPVLSDAVLKKYPSTMEKPTLQIELDLNDKIAQLKAQLIQKDFSTLAARVGGKFTNNKLTLRIFGKLFSVDTQGNFSSDIHINPWIVLAVLGYLLNCQGVPLSGKWVPFRELKNGREQNGLFVQRAEKALKKVADAYPNFFEDLSLIFNGKEVENHYESDISLVLSPLPLLPFLMCYWKPDDGLESDLNLFFDSTAVENSTIEVVFGIGTGIVRMFEKISLTHGAA